MGGVEPYPLPPPSVRHCLLMGNELLLVSNVLIFFKVRFYIHDVELGLYTRAALIRLRVFRRFICALLMSLVMATFCVLSPGSWKLANSLSSLPMSVHCS